MRMTSSLKISAAKYYSFLSLSLSFSDDFEVEIFVKECFVYNWRKSFLNWTRPVTKSGNCSVGQEETECNNQVKIVDSNDGNYNYYSRKFVSGLCVEASCVVVASVCAGWRLSCPLLPHSSHQQWAGWWTLQWEREREREREERVLEFKFH